MGESNKPAAPCLEKTNKEGPFWAFLGLSGSFCAEIRLIEASSQGGAGEPEQFSRVRASRFPKRSQWTQLFMRRNEPLLYLIGCKWILGLLGLRRRPSSRSVFTLMCVEAERASEQSRQRGSSTGERANRRFVWGNDLLTNF